MSLIRIDHFAVITHCLKETIQFYQDVLGLIHGKNLEGGFGEFLYFPDGDYPVIHLLSTEKAKHVDNHKASGFQVYGIPADVSTNTGPVDHIAFKSDSEYFRQLVNNLNHKEIPHRFGKELEPKILQVWFFDPNKIKIEVTCNGDLSKS
ncbi:MAG: dioxygenase [Gammaproteobacteria bacterium]|jgi:catechol 2,3-dioxygenase-like lactoylglutathione lyase family enzyme|nr:dioxygenase [Gammaproteobacteria bacterium]